MPTAYNQGMKATSGDQSLKVEQVNGVMTGIKAPKKYNKDSIELYPTILLFTYNNYYIWHYM